jgi:hypothetical protein
MLLNLRAECVSITSTTQSQIFYENKLRNRAEAGKAGAEKSDSGNAADDEVNSTAARASCESSGAVDEAPFSWKDDLRKQNSRNNCAFQLRVVYCLTDK